MRFYVAAKWDPKERIVSLYDKIKKAGHEITEDWTKHPSVKPYNENQEESKRLSMLDLKGIEQSDVFILLTDKDGAGMYVEFGAAIMHSLMRGKPEIYVIGENLGRSMFFFHPTVRRKKTIEEVLESAIRQSHMLS